VTRIIAGTARGRRIAVPGTGTRPTSDRVREAVFSSLESSLLADGRAWSGMRVLDLYAGSGALGLEALSRGAGAAVLVEKSRSAARVLAANAVAVGAPGAEVLVRDVATLANEPARFAADLCFADPPYDVAADAIGAVLAALHASGWLADDGLVVVERPARDTSSPFPSDWTEERRRGYGDTMLWYGRVAQPDEEQPLP
jgi:16S rRNA (guanine966-N2)-methyltransferase